MLQHSRINIVVAAHKPYWMPTDAMYTPVQVGAFNSEPIQGFQPDNVGENISEKNPRYCELTALYWAWKNSNADYIGLVHYRRHFAGKGDKGTLVLSEAEELLARSDVVLPKKRNYYIETVGAHYAHTFDQTHLEVVKKALKRYSPQMIDAFEKHLNEKTGHIWNMAIMQRNILDEWCDWLFTILNYVEQLIDFKDMTPFEARVMGRLSERLIDPWLDFYGIEYIECPVRPIEKTNWIKKGKGFIESKMLGKKYSESF